MSNITLKAKPIIEIHVQCLSALNVGNTPDGVLCVIPIVGGSFTGKISGKVCSGGADWSTRQSNGVRVCAKYLLQTDDGEFIGIENCGMMGFSDMSDQIKTSPMFFAREDGPYSWLNYGVYVGELNPGEAENTVNIRIFKLM